MLKTMSALSAVLALSVAAAALTSDFAGAADRKTKPARKETRICKTLVGEMVTFGEQSTREGADAALNREIKAWETRYSVKATPQDRKMECKDYIKALNEFECKVTATVCREPAARQQSH